MDGYIIIKYAHGELRYLKHYELDRNGMPYAEWSANMEKSELFLLHEAFIICDIAKGTAVQRVKFDIKKILSK